MKRSWGQPITVRRVDDNIHDVATGDITRSYIDYPLTRTIVMPVTEAVKFKYFSQKFAYGGYFTEQHRFVIIEKRDLAIDLITDDRIMFQNNNYEIAHILEYEDDKAYYLLIRRLSSGD